MVTDGVNPPEVTPDRGANTGFGNTPAHWIGTAANAEEATCPTDGWRYFMRGVFHRDQGDPGTATTSFRIAVQLGRQQVSDDPTDPRHRLELVVYLAAVGEWESARHETDRTSRSGAEPWHIGDALEDLQDHLIDLPGVEQGRLAELMHLMENHRQSLKT